MTNFRMLVDTIGGEPVAGVVRPLPPIFKFERPV
jgi:hypothetical protein